MDALAPAAERTARKLEQSARGSWTAFVAIWLSSYRGHPAAAALLVTLAVLATLFDLAAQRVRGGW